MKRLVPLLISLPCLAQAQEAIPPVEIPMLALSLLGTPYRLGGNSPETGLDCSGLVNLVYRQAVSLHLPRDSASLSQIGQPLEKPALQAGDLVFFNTLNRAYYHVGIYIGEDRFVHASSSKTGSVALSSLNESYWAARFDGARRVIPSAPSPPE